MKFRDKLKNLNVCDESLEWVGNKSLEQAWKTCKDSDWMIWILTKTDLDLTDPICDIAERVLHLVPGDRQLACIWAISAARRRASIDELDAAFSAAYIATENTFNTAYDASNAAAAVASDDFSANYAADAVYYAANAANYDDDDDAYFIEKKKQCDILRKYFTIDQVREAFNKLVDS